MQAKKDKFIFVFIFFLFCLPAIYSQQRIKGFVYGQQGNEPLAYASVFSIRGISSITDSSGQFSFWFPRQVKNKGFNKYFCSWISSNQDEPERINC